MTTFDDRLVALKEIHDLFNGIRNVKTKEALTYKMNEEVDYVIDALETLYYDTIVRHKKWIVPKIHKERHDTIVKTKKTMQLFMPYMIAYNVMNDSVVPDDTLSSASI